MQTIYEAFSTTTEVKRSKFITHLVPMSDYKGLQAQLKSEHPKANHVVYALRMLNEFEQIVENSSDDGEPKGCAGLPALNILRGAELVNCVVLIVRYFGGIKLGTGGMARAYSLATKEVLASATLSLYQKEITQYFDSSYSDIEKILYQLKQLNITKYERDFESEIVRWTIEGEEEKVRAFEEWMVDRQR